MYLAPSTPSSSISSCPEGTVFKGLNYLKDESPILSKPDQDYPAWLWSLASTKKEDQTLVSKSSKKGKKSGIAGEDQQVKLLEKQKKELKLQGRKAIKASNSLKG